jgi:hypothetical protein
MVTPNMKIHTMENIYEMVCESKIMYGIQVQGLSDIWKELDKVICRFCKKLMGLPSCAANGFAEMELWRDRVGEACGTGSKILVSGYVYGYKRSSKTML